MTIANPPYQAGAAATTTAIAGVRLREIDILRGLVICLMALDHVRDYMLAHAFQIDPLDPAQTTPLLYITRWITHLCAPTFVFLAGVSAYLQFARGKTIPNLSRLLLTRGLWLIVLEATVISFGWSLGWPYLPFFQVIWAIGWAMLALSALVWLPRQVVLAIGVAIIAGHNLLDPINAQQLGGGAGIFWTFFHDGGPVFINGQPMALAAYPIFPWFGVIAFGYGLGSIFLEEPKKRDRTLLTLGLSMLALFLVLRGFNLYGNPTVADANTGPFGAAVGWQSQTELGAKIMAFMDVQKYPPSLMFVLATLGIIFTLWPLLARLPKGVQNVFTVFGAVPFFFYVLHIYLVHLVTIVANAATGRDPSGQFGFMINTFVHPEKVQDLGFALPWIYVFWIAVLAMLYLPCRWWGELKRTRRDWWLSYL